MSNRNRQLIGEKITLKINTEDPISAIELSKSLMAFANEYKTISKITHSKIMVSEVRKGSYEFDFIQQAITPILPLVMESNVAIEIIQKFNELKEFFTKDKTDNSTNISIENAKNFKNIVNPIAHNNTTFNNCTINVFSDSVEHKFSASSNEAKIIQKNADRYIADKKIAETVEVQQNDILKDRLLTFVQTRNDDKEYGNKAVCEFITTNEVKTIFDSEDIRNTILDNPYHYAYLADIEVQYVDKQPKVYRILKLNSKVEL